MPFDISIEPFRGDLEALQKMAISSWQDEYGISSFPNLYRPAFVRFLMDCVPDKRHFIAAYKGDEIVSFFANLPRRFRFQGKVYQAVLSCLIVTRKEMFRHGLALDVVKEALGLNKEFDWPVSGIGMSWLGSLTFQMSMKFRYKSFLIFVLSLVCSNKFIPETN